MNPATIPAPVQRVLGAISIVALTKLVELSIEGWKDRRKKGADNS